MLTPAQKAAKLLTLHSPEEYQKEDMLYSVWEDGEITLEKAGSLFNQRTLHCILPGNPEAALPVELLPVRNSDGSHGRIFVRSWEEAWEASHLISNPLA